MAIIKFEFKTTLDFIVSDLTYIQLGFEVKVRKLIEDVISRQESHQAKEFTTLRCLEPPQPSVTFLVVGPL